MSTHNTTKDDKVVVNNPTDDEEEVFPESGDDYDLDKIEKGVGLHTNADSDQPEELDLEDELGNEEV